MTQFNSLTTRADQISMDTVHGGIDFVELERLGLSPKNILDLSSNILPDGPSPRVICAIQNASIDRYPDRESIDLRRAIADHYHIPFDKILVGNGCCELIHLIASSIVQMGDHVMIVGPTFSEYERAAQMAGGIPVLCNAIAETRFDCPMSEIESTLCGFSIRLAWICNPNNPTGRLIPKSILLQWLEEHPQTVFVVDESYIEFTTGSESLIDCCYANLIVLRSMTKAYALAGLRLGFAVVGDSWIPLFNSRRVPWSVNSPAQVAGVAALADCEHYLGAMKRLSLAKRELLEKLHLNGFQTVASDTAYFLMEVDNATILRERLLMHGVLVRDCSSFGLSRYVRIAVGTTSQNQVLVDSLMERPKTLAPTVVEPKMESGWDSEFRVQLERLFQVRRDVRRFRVDALHAGTMKRLLEAACMAPSVGLSQPWRFVSVNSTSARANVNLEFELQNELAASHYDSRTAAEYTRLKLAGLREAPEHLAVFVDPNPSEGRGLGRATMPESVVYSVVAAIQNFWLAARVEGIGVGWVSILRPSQINSILNVDHDWQLVAYLCVGYPQATEQASPELERAGWEHRRSIAANWLER